jgi:hypothetical protein
MPDSTILAMKDLTCRLTGLEAAALLMTALSFNLLSTGALLGSFTWTFAVMNAAAMACSIGCLVYLLPRHRFGARGESESTVLVPRNIAQYLERRSKVEIVLAIVLTGVCALPLLLSYRQSVRGTALFVSVFFSTTCAAIAAYCYYHHLLLNRVTALLRAGARLSRSSGE